MIQISLKGLARFMTSSSLSQRNILRDFKFPDPEGEAQALYYREVRRYVPEFHRTGNPEGWLSRKAMEARNLSLARGGSSGVRLRNVSRALYEYEECWGGKHFQILKNDPLAFYSHNVKVSVHPDLHVLENGTEKLVKLELSPNKPNERLFKIMSQTMYEAAVQAGYQISPNSVLILDVPRGESHHAAKLGTRLRREIEATCQTIADIWSALEPVYRHAS